MSENRWQNLTGILNIQEILFLSYASSFITWIGLQELEEGSVSNMGLFVLLLLWYFWHFFIHPSFVFVTYQPVHQIYYVLIDHVQTKRSKDCVMMESQIFSLQPDQTQSISILSYDH